MLSSKELQFLEKFGTKNTIHKLKSKTEQPEQKIRRIIKDLLDKNILSEVILTPENIHKQDYKVFKIGDSETLEISDIRPYVGGYHGKSR